MNQPLDHKVIGRIRKLLALAADGGATEHEAALAAERAREMMAAHGLSTATVEAAGGVGENRSSEEITGSANEWWQPPLMETIAETCFVWVERRFETDRAKRSVSAGYRLIGRESAVATARVLYDYLCQTVRRAAREADPRPAKPKWFRRGMSERLCERIREKHRAAMRAQAEAARRQNETAGTGAGRALVPVLVDYARQEADLNNDRRCGYPPGRTAQRREESDRRQDAVREERARRKAEAIAAGVSPEVAEWMSWGYDREHAEKMARPTPKEEKKPETEKQRQKREEREERENKKFWERAEREAIKRESPEWQAGRRVAEKVGLDRQVDRGEEKRRIE